MDRGGDAKESKDNSERSHSSMETGPDVHFDDISVLQNGGIVLKRREMTNNVVDGDGGREANTLGIHLTLGVVVDASDAGLDELVSLSTQVYDLLASNKFSKQLANHV